MGRVDGEGGLEDVGWRRKDGEKREVVERG